jgi:hypothetical protein
MNCFLAGKKNISKKPLKGENSANLARNLLSLTHSLSLSHSLSLKITHTSSMFFS